MVCRIQQSTQTLNIELGSITLNWVPSYLTRKVPFEPISHCDTSVKILWRCFWVQTRFGYLWYRNPQVVKGVSFITEGNWFSLFRWGGLRNSCSVPHQTAQMTALLHNIFRAICRSFYSFKYFFGERGFELYTFLAAVGGDVPVGFFIPDIMYFELNDCKRHKSAGVLWTPLTAGGGYSGESFTFQVLHLSCAICRWNN